MKKQCILSGREFQISEQEQALRAKCGLEGLPQTAPEARIRHLGAFWPHFHLHQRKCDASGENLISIYSPDCPHPVWHKDRWVKESNPPQAGYSQNEPVFAQLWQLFQRCPIPHNIGVANENCEYTDDWWYSRNCYLCHSGYNAEDLRYCYRARNSSDCEFLAFVFDCQLSVDVINSRNCFNLIYGVNCRQVNDSAFMYDCRNCNNCMFCFNLRNKEYCFGNQQLSKAEYEKKRAEWNLASRKVYDQAIEQFRSYIFNNAWHRALLIDQSEECTGNFIENSRECENCFFLSGNDSCVNCVRSVSGDDINCLDSVGHFGGQLLANTVIAQDGCYEVVCSYNVIESKFLQYCAYCLQCENCFGCCGLVKKKFHIFNKEYAEEEYYRVRDQIIENMKQQGIYGEFFPGFFSPVPYDESWAAAHFPLSAEEQQNFGFRVRTEEQKSMPPSARSASEIPDDSRQVSEETFKQIFWDEEAKRPIRISPQEAQFARKIGAPLNNQYYLTRLKENFKWLMYNGRTRTTTCAKSGKQIETFWPESFDGRILSEEEYLNEIG